MCKNLKVMALIAITAFVVAMPVTAQTLPDPDDGPAGLSSNTLRATAGLFGNSVDDSMSLTGWTGLEFDSWMGFVGYGGDLEFNPISLGYATRLGGLYLGTWYTGNIVRSTRDRSETLVVDYNLNEQRETGRTTTIIYDGNWRYSNNQIEALFGTGNMGLKIGFWENLAREKEPDSTGITITEGGNTIQYNDQNYIEYSRIIGHLRPSIDWGMELEVGDMTITPSLGVALGFFLDRKILKDRGAYSTLNGAIVGDEEMNFVGFNNGFFAPAINLGVDIGLAQAEGSNASRYLSLGYGITFRSYNNSYDDSGVRSGKANGFVEWDASTTIDYSNTDHDIITDYVTLDFDDQSYVNHSISLGFTYENQVNDNFKFGIYAGLPIGITVQSSETHDEVFRRVVTQYHNPNFTYRNTTVVTEEFSPKDLENTTTFSIAPELSFGAVYDLVPNRFSVNTGFRIMPFNYERDVVTTSRSSNQTITQTTTTDGEGNSSVTITSDGGGTDSTRDFVERTSTWNRLEAGVFGGFTFHFNNNAALDMSIGLGNDPEAEFTFNITNVNVLFSFRF